MIVVKDTDLSSALPSIARFLGLPPPPANLVVTDYKSEANEFATACSDQRTAVLLKVIYSIYSS
jgi:hypothetical protein